MKQQSLFEAAPLIYNTGFMTEPQKEQIAKSAMSQEERILEFLAKYPRKGYDAETIRMRLGGRDLIVSIRRALTTLKKNGRVEKLGTKVGQHNVNVHLWRIL